MEAQPVDTHALATLHVPHAKLSIPQTSHTLVRRARAMELLDQARDAPVTIVVAPAGYGKTTTVAQWVATTNHVIAWISLGVEDNNPSKFLSCLVTALRAIDPAMLQDVVNRAAHQVGFQESIESILHALGLVTRQFFLVLDDFHTIVNRDILHTFMYLLNRLPPQIHVVLVSRTTPKLALGRLRANDSLREIHIADLQFSLEESRTFRSAAGITEVDDAQWEVVSARTEGWVAGLQLARLIIKGQRATNVERFLASFESGIQEIDDYLLEEVISGLPDDLRVFMLRSSLLPFLEPGFCNFVLQTDRSSLLIRALRERNLFVTSVENDQQWLRYHHLLQDALERRLGEEVGPEEINAIHARTAAWLADHGQAEQALIHAAASQQWEIATRLAHQISEPLTVSDRMTSMFYWLDLFPSQVVLDDPELRSVYLWALALVPRFSANLEPLVLIDAAHPDDTFDARVHLVRMQISYAKGDDQGMRHHAERALALTPEDMLDAKLYGKVVLGAGQYFGGAFDLADATLAEVRRLADVGGQDWMLFAGEVRVADSLALRGQLDDASEILEDLDERAVRAMYTGNPQINWYQASIHLERNNLTAAEMAITKALATAETPDQRRWLPVVLVTKAMIAWAQGTLELAYACVARAGVEATALDNPNFVTRANALQAAMWVADGRLILAERWRVATDLSPTWVREFNQPYAALTAVRLAAAQGDPQRALRSLAEIIAATTARGRTGDLVRLYAIKAGILHTLEWPDEAAEALAYAVDLGANGGFLRSFLDEGNTIAGLFNHPLLRGHTHRHYAQLVKRSFETGTVMAPTAPGPLLESLSPRELDVLRLVAAGGSNRSIAQELFISEPTVKKHISNLYGKLQVLNRMQAVALAREVGIL